MGSTLDRKRSPRGDGPLKRSERRGLSDETFTQYRHGRDVQYQACLDRKAGSNCGETALSAQPHEVEAIQAKKMSPA